MPGGCDPVSSECSGHLAHSPMNTEQLFCSLNRFLKELLTSVRLYRLEVGPSAGLNVFPSFVKWPQAAVLRELGGWLSPPRQDPVHFRPFGLSVRWSLGVFAETEGDICSSLPAPRDLEGHVGSGG